MDFEDQTADRKKARQLPDGGGVDKARHSPRQLCGAAKWNVILGAVLAVGAGSRLDDRLGDVLVDLRHELQHRRRGGVDVDQTARKRGEQIDQADRVRWFFEATLDPRLWPIEN